MLREINYKVISYCEIPEDIVKGRFEEYYPDCFVIRSVPILKYRSDFDKWVVKTYPELENQSFMIEIDY